jgi:xylulokinase
VTSTHSVQFVGIDIGTSGAKGVVVDGDGHVVASARHEHRVETLPGGRVEHDADAVWWGSLRAVAHGLLTSSDVDARKIQAIACSGIGPCVLPVDEQCRPLGRAILYGIDTRATEQITMLESRLGKQTIFARAGNYLTSQSAGPKIAWLREHDVERHRAARYFLTSQSYLVAKLTGVVVIDHATASYFHPLYDLAAASWDITGCRDFVSTDQLPRLAWSSDIAGPLSSAGAAATGFRRGTPVIVGTADAPAEAVASGVVDPGDVMIMYGSSSFMIEMTRSDMPSEALWSARYVFEGTHCLAAGTSTAGTLTMWLLAMLGLDDLPRQEAFIALSELASDSPPGARGLFCLPYLSGERTPIHDPNVRGLFAGMALHHTRADVSRAAIEGIAHAMVRAIECFTDHGIDPVRLLAAGGGTRNPVWLQAVSDILGRDQQVTAGAGACVGDAALAALGVGHLTSPRETAQWVRRTGTVRAEPDRFEAYADDHRRFQTWTGYAQQLASDQLAGTRLAP